MLPSRDVGPSVCYEYDLDDPRLLRAKRLCQSFHFPCSLPILLSKALRIVIKNSPTPGNSLLNVFYSLNFHEKPEPIENLSLSPLRIHAALDLGISGLFPPHQRSQPIAAESSRTISIVKQVHPVYIQDASVRLRKSPRLKCFTPYFQTFSMSIVPKSLSTLMLRSGSITANSSPQPQAFHPRFLPASLAHLELIVGLQLKDTPDDSISGKMSARVLTIVTFHTPYLHSAKLSIAGVDGVT